MSASTAYTALFTAGAALAAWALTMFIRRMALAKSVLDTPNERSCHTIPTPRGGGLGFVITFIAACLLDMALEGAFAAPSPVRVLAILTPLSLLGLADDIHGLSARLRLPCHLAVGVLMLILFPRASHVFGDSQLSVALVSAAIVIGAAALINFYNFMDGTDALVAGCFAVQGLFFYCLLGQDIWLPASFAVLGFLFWNRPPARIFMGDAGSTFLGGAAALAIVAGLDSSGPALPALTVTLPLTGDATYTIVRRLLRGENIFMAHRQHIYQRLHILAGWSHGRVALMYVFLTAAFGAAVKAFGTTGAWLALASALALIPAAELHIARIDRQQAERP